MQTKPLLIAVAAFAVTVTGAYAQGNADRIFERANLSEEQRSALETAHELREQGEIEAARDALVEAGFDEEKLLALHRAGREVHEEIESAIEANDYTAFEEVVAGTPLEQKITSQADFELLVEAHQLRKDGDFDGAREILNELDIEPKGHMKGHYKAHRGLAELSDEQRDALKVARQANDKEAVKAILEEAGIERGSRHTYN